MLRDAQAARGVPSSGDPLSEFVGEYYRSFISVLSSFDRAPLNDMVAVLDGVIERGATLWLVGNGGSAAISDHAACDLTKGARVPGAPVLRCLSLSSNASMLSALSNDAGYDRVFSEQLSYYGRPGDAVLLVSSAGNSPNVVAACEHANRHGLPTLAFVGFAGGRLKELARHCIWVPSDNYGIVEDTHQSLIHVLTQYLRCRNGARVPDVRSLL
jgi:D-sedoheptulose 7-phosphate isomerase